MNAVRPEGDVTCQRSRFRAQCSEALLCFTARGVKDASIDYAMRKWLGGPRKKKRAKHSQAKPSQAHNGHVRQAVSADAGR